MKKTFSLNTPNKKPGRQADSIKHEVKKYLGRERRKIKPEGVDFWDFDCQIGDCDTNCNPVEVNQISASIDKMIAEGKEVFYIEILAKPGKKIPKKK